MSERLLLWVYVFFLIVPGMRVTVYLPPYFVGLKISDCTVAMAEVYVSVLLATIQDLSRA